MYDPLEYIREYYSVPANKGQRVEVELKGERKQGKIVGAHNAYIKVMIDGEKTPRIYHPTDAVEYLTSK